MPESLIVRGCKYSANEIVAQPNIYIRSRALADQRDWIYTCSRPQRQLCDVTKPHQTNSITPLNAETTS